MFTTTETSFTASDRTVISYRFSNPRQPRALIIILHGLGEHSGRYEHVMEFLHSAGFASAAPDHRGHGKTAVVPGLLEDIFKTAEDIRRLTESLREALPEQPVFLLGHSMGGLITLLTLIRHQQLYQGAILSGAAAAIPDNVSPLLRAASAVLSRLTPRLPVQDFNFDAVCRDPAVVDATKTDPLFYRGKVRARTGAEILRGIMAVRASLRSLSLPLLILHGEKDSSVPPEASRFIHRTAGSADKTLKIYPGLFHEIMNEPEKQEVFSDIEAWIQTHLNHETSAAERRHQKEG